MRWLIVVLSLMFHSYLTPDCGLFPSALWDGLEVRRYCTDLVETCPTKENTLLPPHDLAVACTVITEYPNGSSNMHRVEWYNLANKSYLPLCLR